MRGCTYCWAVVSRDSCDTVIRYTCMFCLDRQLSELDVPLASKFHQRNV